MQGPFVEIVLLLLLILYLGLQLRTRPRLQYRLWFLGWVLVGVAYAIWEVPLRTGTATALQDALRFNFMIAGTLFFLLSFLTRQTNLWKVVQQGLMVGVPALLAMDALQFLPVPRPVLMLAVLAWEGYGLRAAYLLLPRGRIKTRQAIYTICCVYAVAMLLYLALTDGRDLSEWAVTEVVLCTAVLYGGGAQRRTLAVVVGAIGFVSWAGFYLAAMAGDNHPGFLRLVYAFWNFPKFFVGFSMILKTLEDVTEEKSRLAEQFKTLYNDFRMLYEGHPQAMWIYEEEDGRFLSANAAAIQQYGFSLEEFLAMQPAEMFRLSETERTMVEALYPESKLRFARHVYKDGRSIWATVDTHAVQFSGKDAVLLSAWDVTEQLETRRHLEHRVNHDALTGLPNRTLFADRVQQCMARCDRDGRKTALLTIDVDHFKQVNDTYGHAVGDHCLQIVASRLSSKIREVDTLARTGGEEFAAVIGGMHVASDAQKIADALLSVFTAPMRLGELELQVSVSIGVAVYPDDAGDAESLKRLSDEALYAAKRGGRNRAAYASAKCSEAPLPALPALPAASMQSCEAAAA